jgi:hypothetical protein
MKRTALPAHFSSSRSHGVLNNALGFVALLAGIANSVWAIAAGSVASAPVELYWPFPFSVFLLTAGGYAASEFNYFTDTRARNRQLAEEFERGKEERERHRRCMALSNLERLEFEDQFLLALYQATDGDTRWTGMEEVWAWLDHECAPELTRHAIKVWRERKCVKVDYWIDAVGNMNLR